MWLDDGGSSRLVAVEARVIASVDSSREGELLEPELKKRLAVHRIDLPPLRHRREDLPGLVRLLVTEICDAQQMPAKTVSSQAISLLCALPWRGNFTELRGLLQTLVASPGRMIRVADVLTHVRLDGDDVSLSTSGTLKQARERFERDYVAAVLRQHHGRMAQAARVLGMQRPNLYRKVRQLAVTRKGPAPLSVEEDSLEIQ
jgi:DNA-binding NtrC family response regulator